jgi:hypothetical protein
MAKTIMSAQTTAGIITQMEALLSLAGWNDDGAPTAKIWRSAADSEGRTAYALIRQSAGTGGVAVQLGSQRVGDTCLDPASNAGSIRSFAVLTDRPYFMWANDRWFCVHGLGDNADYVFLFAGILETTADLVDQPAPLILSGSRTDADANLTVQMARGHASGQWWIYSKDVPNAFGYHSIVSMNMWSNSGARAAPTKQKFSPRSSGLFVNGCIVHPAMFLAYYTPYPILGTLKEAYFGYGAILTATTYAFGRCKIGDDWYVNPACTNECSWASAGGVQLLIKDS